MRLTTVEIKGLIEASLLDWPGKLATVIFLPGCNLRCGYCHARDIVLGAASLESIPVDATLAFICEMREWVDGVVISGGEPTLHAELPSLAAEIKALGLGVKLDTNGTRPGVLQRLIDDELVDAVSMDLKAPLDYRYFELAQTAFDLEDLRRSIRVLMRSKLEYEFRTTVSPSFLSPSEVADIARTIEGAARYALQAFNPHVCIDKSLESLPPCPPAYLEDAARLARGFVAQVVVRT